MSTRQDSISTWLNFNFNTFQQISTRFNKFQHVSTNFNMTHSRDSISTQDSMEVLFSSLSLVSRHSSRIGYELYLADLPVLGITLPFFRWRLLPGYLARSTLVLATVPGTVVITYQVPGTGKCQPRIWSRSFCSIRIICGPIPRTKAVVLVPGTALNKRRTPALPPGNYQYCYAAE